MLLSFGLFFLWHKWNGGGGWSATAFCFVCWSSSLQPQWSLRNEDCNVLLCGGIAKSVTEKKQRRVGVGWLWVIFIVETKFQ